ncbi:uncharacterized protein JCM6883_003567 [Sporobolomyces salmoneus]|uniref:uncharacterized protein n=1 Tax=Sporobolomyces salmoneus TaxID=183962 RepID=UPI003180F463
MSLGQPNEVDFSAFVDERLFQDDALPSSTSHPPPAPSESTPTASASSGGSPSGFSPLPHPDTALTSTSTSPRFASTEFPTHRQSMDKLPDELEQIAASLFAAQQQHDRNSSTSSPSLTLPMSIGASQPSSIPPYLQSMQASSFPSQLPLDLINAANIAPSSSLPVTPLPNFSGSTSPTTVPSFYGSMPSTPYPGLNPYGPVSTNPSFDPGLYALHASLEAQARLAAATSMSAPGTPSGVDLLHHQQQQQQYQPSSLSGSSTPAPTSPHLRNSGRPAPKRTASSSYMKAAMGFAGSNTGHQRSQTLPVPSGTSPQASPAPLPNAFDPTNPYTATHQRPLPPLPKRQTHASMSAAHLPPLPTSSANPTPPLSRAQSPRHNLPPVHYDFSSLEQDLDRFTSSGGFASAAAAAMASVGPSSRRGHQGVDACGVGGYGGSPTPKFPEALPSPKLVADVLGRESVFHSSLPGSTHPSPAQQSASSPSNPNQALPAGIANVLSSETGSNKPSPVDSASPAGSTIIDEESAELLSQKDPIAAQVWRMFHKAKNTMPNGARMENLTWRLMSMTLRKRREESANSANGSSNGEGAVNTASPGTEDAKLRRAMEEAIEEEREEKEVVEEGRDVVQPLVGGRGRNAQPRGRRERTGSSEEAERGRTRGTKNGTSSKSASPEVEVEAPEAMDWRALSKSRSRSRAPDMMDWRAQSRSRSRAPELRTSMAPPTVDSTPATANFSRFFGDNGVPSSSLSTEMPPPALPTTSSSSASTSQPRSVVEPLNMPALPEDDNSAALAELASSLGLSPQDQAQLFGSASARLDGHSLLDLPSPTNGLISPPVGTSRLTSPGPLSPQTNNSFAFPDSTTTKGVDPNLAAIESALNQLINLQSLASSPSSTAPSPRSNDGTPHPHTKSPNPTFSPSPLANSTEAPVSRSRQASSSSNNSLAQRQLQQFVTKSNPPSVNSGTRRASGSTSSAYGNAAALASSTRPFSFNTTATSPSASGISLARPAHLPTEASQPLSPYSEQPPFLFPASAPSNQAQYLGSPNPPLFAEGMDTANLLFDYFNPQQDNSSYPSFVSGSEFGSLPAPTHVDPSQLLHSRETPYGSAGSSWDTHAQSFVGSPHGGIGLDALPSPPTTSSAHSGKSRLSVSSSGGRSSSTSNLAGLSSSLPSSSSKTKSAPTSRVHSRSNTVSLPPPIQEGKTLEFDNQQGAGGDDDQKEKRDGADDSGVTRCLNCSTTNTPLWRRDAEGKPLCNACGLFRNLHGVDRPAGLNTGVIKRRNRNRGPKDATAKKGTKTGPARRNSVNTPGTPAVASAVNMSRKERSGVAGAPYPTAAQRAQQE